MSKITFKTRTGKDLFEFMSRSVINQRLANDWAMEEFVQIDGKSIDIEDIAQLNSTAYIIITSKIFATNTPDLKEDNEGIWFRNQICIKTKPLHRDFITEMQALQERKSDPIALMKFCLINYFDVTIAELETMSYELTAYLVAKINFFLSSLSTSEDSFDLSNVWATAPQKTVK